MIANLDASAEAAERGPAATGLPDLEDPSINVCFSTTSSLLSGWIRLVTRAPVSHALITYRCRTLARVMVMEATGRGFNVVPWRRWKQHNRLVARFAIDEPVATQVRALHGLAEDLGSEYDSLSLFGFALRRWQKRSKNLLDDPRKLICSEAVAKFLKAVGVAECRDPGEWTPADLFEHLLSDPGRFPRVEEGEHIERAVARATARGRKGSHAPARRRRR